MAKKDGSTVILTIHQPREYILSMFTNIILLSQGKLIYFGSVPNAVKHFERCGYPCPVHTNPSDHFLDVITVDISSNEMQMKSLERVKAMEEQWSNETLPPVQYTSPAANPKQDCDKRWTNSFLYELRVLCERGIKEEIRDKATIGATFGQAIVNTLLLGFVFWRIPLDSKGTLRKLRYITHMI